MVSQVGIILWGLVLLTCIIRLAFVSRTRPAVMTDIAIFILSIIYLLSIVGYLDNSILHECFKL